MPNTSVIDTSDEDINESPSGCHHIKFGRITPTLSDWLNELLGLNGIILQMSLPTDRTLVI